MLLRNGKVYNKQMDVKTIIMIQTLFRGKKVYWEFHPYLHSLQTLIKRFPHLQINQKSKKRVKKKSVKKKSVKNKIKKNVIKYESGSNSNNDPNDDDDYGDEDNDDAYIVKQYNSLKNMGSNIINGYKRSTRKNKGLCPDRYVDDNFIELMLEESTIEDVLESGSDVDTDFHSDGKVNSEYSDGEWDDSHSNLEESSDESLDELDESSDEIDSVH